MQKIHIGIHGASGVLGKQILKIKDKIKYISYKGDIRSKNKIKKWFKKIILMPFSFSSDSSYQGSK